MRSAAAKWRLLAAIFLLGLLADQATKFLVTRFLELYERVEVLPVLDFTLLHNTGAAFSMLANASGWQRPFFIGLGLMVSALLVAGTWAGVYRLSSSDRSEAVSDVENENGFIASAFEEHARRILALGGVAP